jgi:hypothetical protein
MPLDTDTNHSSYKNQIYTLLGVLSAAVICALLLAGILIYYYGPSGKYLAGNTLLESNLATTLSYDDTNIKTGGMSRFVFDGIDFSYHDKRGEPQLIEISPELYQKLYRIIANDSSLLQIPENTSTLFNKSDLNVLSIRVRTESHAGWQDESKRFQEVQFSPQGNYYRIQLHEEDSSNRWVYFYHPDIYQSVLKALIP